MKGSNKHKTKFGLLVTIAQVFLCFALSAQTPSSNRFKRIDYEYDLVSGKVNIVSYQKDSADQFIHQYTYDSDNRITKVETSNDNLLWDVDAKYYYYAHGPLARVELGNDKVQGIDYAYTLQGWIKGVNSNSLDNTKDIGQDGLATEIYDPTNPQLHSGFAKDAVGYTLNYYQGDYKAISYVRWSPVTNRFEASTVGSQMMQQTNDLFNGNIKSMVTTITQVDTTNVGVVKPQIAKPLGNAYKYDQLNRIKSSVSFTNINTPGNLWQSSGQSIANMYKNSFTYDANGNILTQNRSDEGGNEFEAIQYKYGRDANGKLLQNRLYHVNDNTSYTGLKTDDIDDQGTFTSNLQTINTNNNYSFDGIGNLIKDKNEQIDTIEWTVYGKIKRITRISTSTKDNLVFDYDASGNRIAKHVYDNGNNWKYSTYYVRDAQGNVMSTYENKNTPPPSGSNTPGMSYVLQEQHLYGSSRIGMNTPNKQLINSNSLTNVTHNHFLGQKQFEIGNHLSNILSVISDKKIPLDNNGDNIIDEYQVDLLTSSDYSPFGVKLYKRGSFLENYRYGFLSQEKSDEINGSGNTYMFTARIYDVRLGRWLSPDPMEIKFPGVTPYRYGLNNPIFLIDVEGLTEYPITVRAFIPSFDAGLGTFRGDNRTFSTKLDVTSRINHRFTLDTEKSILVNKKIWSDPTVMWATDPLCGGKIPVASAEATPKDSYSNITTSATNNAKTFNFTTGMEGSDPLAPGAPTIDWSNSFSIEEQKGKLAVSLNTKGDKYPAIEAFISDPSGQSVFIGVNGAKGNIFNAYGKGEEQQINNTIFISTDKKGNFTGVRLQGSDTYMSVSDWNKQFEKLDANKGEKK